VAILREQGVNGQVEMAAAFDRAGFAAVDVHMSDLLAGRANLADFQRIGGVRRLLLWGRARRGERLGKDDPVQRPAQGDVYAVFRAPDSFSLGVCNGCQMMAQLRDIIPGTAAWPSFGRNVSARFEARLCMVAVEESPSLFFDGMSGARIPIVVAHGEGHVSDVITDAVIGLRYIDTYGKVTEHYPLNPSGSVQGVAGLT
jgi:phosphoribosylformylglycinamidine synthase